ncbi:Na+/H+ antiporter subunit D [Cohaesibacter celericrescens]|uniref:Na+/H+ antiporter subunit D n=1 Tax=Cohaesibacter celericrescens TaxID=2067669 RepID=UPI00356860A5
MAGNAEHAVDFSAGMLVAPTQLSDWLVIAPIIITILGGAFILMLRERPKHHGYFAVFFLSLLVIADFLLLAQVLEKGPITMTMGRWLPPFGISFSVDAFGASLTTIAGIVALLVCIYSLVDITNTGRRYGFYPLFMLLMAGVSGSFLTGDIFNLYVWFEVLLISSFGLLILGGKSIQIDGALKYAVLNLMATTLFLIATGYLYGTLGSLNMADITLKIRSLPEGSAPMATIGALYFLAFAMKAAAFPVNFWLPASYHTPNIVVSAIFAGLLTKVGIYALIRTLVMLMPESWAILTDVIAWIAAVTMIVGALGALAQNDVRRMLGYLVVAGIGAMLVGVAVGTETALIGTILYAVHSILVIAALYLALGILMRMNGGKSRLSELGGGYKASSLLSILFLILVFAASGLPPFSGFWAKFALVESSLREDHNWLAFTILLSGFLTTIAMGRVWTHAFWRGGPIGTQDGHDAAPLNRMARSIQGKLFVPVTVLVLMSALIGIFPSPMFSIAQTSASGLLKPDKYIDSVFGAAIEQKQSQMQGQTHIGEGKEQDSHAEGEPTSLEGVVDLPETKPEGAR